MKRTILYLVMLQFTMLSTVFCQVENTFTKLSFEEADHQADSILNLMDLDEKIRLIGGERMFYTRDIKRLDIPSVPFVDATQGVRINPAIISKGLKKPVKKSIAYPAPILLAATWNRSMSYSYAHSIGEECRAANLPVLLGPGFNIYRNSQCGRSFEYMGEDPCLVGNLVAEYVKGLQETGTIATLKHFVANQTDYYRKKSNSVVDERALQEIYMPAFKYGIDAGALAVMTSYNLVNGEWAGQSDYVIKHLLRDELGFKWLVMTDWFSVWDGEKVIKSGQELEMPFRRATKKAKKLVKNGIVTEDIIDHMVKSILRTFIAMGSFEGTKDPLSEDDYKRLEEVSLNTAREGMVLLRNDKKLLPIDKSKKQKILATGEFLDDYYRGGGAAKVKGYDIIVMKEALRAEFGEQVVFVKTPTESQLKEADIVLLSVGTRDAEAKDRPFELPEKQDELVEFCTLYNPNTVIIVTSGGGVRMSHWENAHTILYTWYMGQNGATAVAEILSGKTNPSGKLPITIEQDFEDSPAFGYIPPGEELYSRYTFRGERTHEVYDIEYHEGILVGYRWYDHFEIEPEFCFGHGLSYTSFDYSNLTLSSTSIDKKEGLEVKVTIKNTGKLNGAEIVQLYLTDRKCTFDRPPKELKGFDKVFLNAGESKVITIKLKPEDFAFWNPDSKRWCIEEGAFDILIGASNKDIRLKSTIQIQ